MALGKLAKQHTWASCLLFASACVLLGLLEGSRAARCGMAVFPAALRSRLGGWGWSVPVQAPAVPGEGGDATFSSSLEGHWGWLRCV